VKGEASTRGSVCRVTAQICATALLLLVLTFVLDVYPWVHMMGDVNSAVISPCLAGSASPPSCQ